MLYRFSWVVNNSNSTIHDIYDFNFKASWVAYCLIGAYTICLHLSTGLRELSKEMLKHKHTYTRYFIFILLILFEGRLLFNSKVIHLFSFKFLVIISSINLTCKFKTQKIIMFKFKNQIHFRTFSYLHSFFKFLHPEYDLNYIEICT